MLVVGDIEVDAEFRSRIRLDAASIAFILDHGEAKLLFVDRAFSGLAADALRRASVKPMVIDIEGRTLQLKGSAEEQYAEWRRLLKDLYENETGLPAATSSTAPGAEPPGATRP